MLERKARTEATVDFPFPYLTALPGYSILTPNFLCTNPFTPITTMATRHVVFEVSQAENGSWSALGIGDDIFTGGGDFEELKVNVVEAIRAHFSGEDCEKFEVRLAQLLSQFMFAA
jgi:hypothetical protein